MQPKVFSLKFYFIPESAQRYDLIAIFSKRRTQHFYVRVHRTVVAVEIVAPYIAKQFFTGNGYAVIFYKIEQQLVFLGRHFHFFAVHKHVSAGDVDFQSVGLDEFLFSWDECVSTPR